MRLYQKENGMKLRSIVGVGLFTIGTSCGLIAQESEYKSSPNTSLGTSASQDLAPFRNLDRPEFPSNQVLGPNPSGTLSPSASRSLRVEETAPTLPSSVFGQTPSNFSQNDESRIKIRYPELVKSKIMQEQNGKVHAVDVYSYEIREVFVDRNAILDEIDLPTDGKRLAVLTITAQRHDKLLQALVDAKTEEEKTTATKALKDNYIEHYAIESWWRAEKLKELEKRLEVMRAQVKQRQESQEKYVDAAMTIASLHAQGISIAPPRPAFPEPEIPGNIANPQMVPQFQTRYSNNNGLNNNGFGSLPSDNNFAPVGPKAPTTVPVQAY